MHGVHESKIPHEGNRGEVAGAYDMTNLIRFPNLRRIREEAPLWIARIDRELSDEEMKELEQWLSDSPKHREAFLEAASLWDDMDVLTRLSSLFPLEGSRPVPKKMHWKHLSALAAVLVFLAIVLLRPDAGMLQPPASEPMAASKPDTTSAAQTYLTVIGQQSLVSLSDGSQVRLNTDSLIEVVYGSDFRRVHLVRGEAHFEIAKDASRPFDVLAGNHVVRAIGTAFNVRMPSIERMEVTVTEGRIRLMNDEPRKTVSEEPVSLSGAESPIAVAGQLVTVESSGKPRVRDLPLEELADLTAWQRGKLVFRGEPLREVLQEFARYTNLKFIPNDETIGDIPVGGVFRAADVEGLMMALRENFGLRTSIVGDAVVIARNADTSAALNQ